MPARSRGARKVSPSPEPGLPHDRMYLPAGRGGHAQKGRVGCLHQQAQAQAVPRGQSPVAQRLRPTRAERPPSGDAKACTRDFSRSST